MYGSPRCGAGATPAARGEAWRPDGAGEAMGMV